MSSLTRMSLAALALVPGACTNGAAAPEPAPVAVAAAPAPLIPPLPVEPLPPEPAMLAGTRWILVEAGGEPVPEGTRPATLEFGDGSLGGHSGCNAYGTQYELDGRRFVTASVESDAQGCGPPVGTVEQRLFAALRSPFDVAFDARERLVVLKDGAPALRFRRVPPAPPLAGRPTPAALAGTRWRLVEADGRRILGDPAYRLVTLDFGDGTFGGYSGCNGYGTQYRLQGARFLPTPPMATQRGCGQPVGTLERRLFAILGAPFEVDADADGRLVILSGGVPVLRFQSR